MRDYESNDLDGAAFLADEPEPVERPTDAELRDDRSYDERAEAAYKAVHEFVTEGIWPEPGTLPVCLRFR